MNDTLSSAVHCVSFTDHDMHVVEEHCRKSDAQAHISVAKWSAAAACTRVRCSCCGRYTECAEGELEAGTTASSTEQSRSIADRWNDMRHSSRQAAVPTEVHVTTT